jgi:hypothetical protein
MIRTALCKFVLLIGLSGAISSCNRNTYPCPDIQGGTEVVKADDLKKVEPETDDNGRLVKKPYAHPGMKKKRR